jgi:hypothetical protein
MGTHAIHVVLVQKASNQGEEDNPNIDAHQSGRRLRQMDNPPRG